MLLGLMYCRSNRLQRAQKFYELVEIELTESLTNDDPEFVAYMPIMLEISNGLMLRLYERHRNQTPGSGQPEIVITDYLPQDHDVVEKLRGVRSQRWLKELFMGKFRLSREAVEERLSQRIYYLLQPHFIRSKAYENWKEM